MEETTIFTKIIRGEVPCHKIYEDDNTLAFLDIHPAAVGHTLVISKRQVSGVWDLENTEYSALMDSVKKIADRLKEILEAPYVGEMIIGVDVPHAHVHLIPFSQVSSLQNVFEHSDIEPNHDLLAELANRLRF
jgi:histidine triad (HIT) family protein